MTAPAVRYPTPTRRYHAVDEWGDIVATDERAAPIFDLAHRAGLTVVFSDDVWRRSRRSRR